MKIFCIGRNYANHAKELGNQIPKEPVIFIKPSTALNTENDFYLPSFDDNIQYELELVIKINRTIKNVSIQEASMYFDQIALGIDFTARDLQSKLKDARLPWEKAKAFDKSAYLSEFVDIERLNNLDSIKFELYKNETVVQEGNSSDMLFNFNELISSASHYFTLVKGDLLYTGTPAGVGKVVKGDILRGSLEYLINFSLEIK